MRYRVKRFSKNKVLDTRGANSLGFTKDRKYDTDLDRFSRIDTSQGELSRPNTLNNELKKLRFEINSL